MEDNVSKELILGMIILILFSVSITFWRAMVIHDFVTIDDTDGEETDN